MAEIHNFSSSVVVYSSYLGELWWCDEPPPQYEETLKQSVLPAFVAACDRLFGISKAESLWLLHWALLLDGEFENQSFERYRGTPSLTTSNTWINYLCCWQDSLLGDRLYVKIHNRPV